MAKTFQEQMDEVVTNWETNPIPTEFKNNEHNMRYCSVEGVIQQLDSLPNGPGKIFVAVTDIINPNSISIKTLEVFKQ